jgi:hypothetical protein
LRTKGHRVAVYSQRQPCHDPGGPSLSRRSVACGSTTLPFWTASGMDTHPTVRATVGHPADPNEGCKWRKMRVPRLDRPNQCPEFIGRRTQSSLHVSSGSSSAQARPREAGYDIATAAIGPAAIKSVAKEGQRVNNILVAPSIRGMSGEGRVDVSAIRRPLL